MQVRHLLTVFILILVIVGSVRLALADSDSTRVQKPEIPSAIAQVKTSGLDVAVRLLIALAIISVLIYISVWGLKRLSQFRPGGNCTGGNIQIVDNSYLGPKRGLHVVRAGSKFVLIASSETSMSFICELNSEDFKDANAKGVVGKGQGKFQEVLERLRGSGEKPFLRRIKNAESVP